MSDGKIKPLTEIIQKPSLGRIVHFNYLEKNGNLVASAAIIVHVHSDTCVNLKVFAKDYNEQDTIITSVVYGAYNYSWSWPPRVVVFLS